MSFDVEQYVQGLVGGPPKDVVHVAGRLAEDGSLAPLTVAALAALVVGGEVKADAMISAGTPHPWPDRFRSPWHLAHCGGFVCVGGMEARPLQDLLDMEMVAECEPEDAEELSASLGESMRDAGARLPAGAGA